jgi:formyltetrahydrofolate-dependent phosphoribosylglycinamide formyltransferase
MLKRLRERWRVNGWKLVLILLTFAAGGTLTGYAGRKFLSLTRIESPATYFLLYFLLIALLWPLMVLLISIPLGQFVFFRTYLRRLFQKGRKLQFAHGMRSMNEKETKADEPGKEKKSGQKPGNGNLKRLTIFASGAGSNAREVIAYFRNSEKASVNLVVCNKPGAGVIQVAEKENIPVLMVGKERFFRGDAYLPELQDAKTDLIILAGFLWKIPDPLVRAFPKRILNIHPALLPKYGGRGMYGAYVHEAVLQAGEMQSGITIHYVDEHYDHGDVIFQTACPVMEGDTSETLAHRIHQLEHLHYPRVIEEVLDHL